MPRPDVWLKPAGLMRCCLATIHADTDRRDAMPSRGELLRCLNCGGMMRFNDDEAWEWASEIPRER